MKRISPQEAIKAIAEYRRVLVLNGHRPNTEDSRMAVAQAQLDYCEEEHKTKVQEIFKEIKTLFADDDGIITFIRRRDNN